MKLQIAGIVDDSIVDGDGCRLTVFVQGCAHRCPGCQNPETQPMEGGRTIDTTAILQQMAENPILSGITFSGSSSPPRSRASPAPSTSAASTSGATAASHSKSSQSAPRKTKQRAPS